MKHPAFRRRARSSWISRATAVASLSLALATPLCAQAKALWTIGGEEDVGTELGRLPRALLLPRHVVVLERDGPHLKLFDLRGRLLQQTGRSGGGPEEFRRPTALAYNAGAKELLVVDGHNLRVTIYPIADTLGAPRMLTIDESGAADVCLLGSRLFGIAKGSPSFVRELVEEGARLRAVRSFAKARTLHPLGTHPGLANEAAGLMHCDTAGDRLVIASQTLGEVHFVRPDGSAHETVAIPGFKAPEFSIRGGLLTASLPYLASRDAVDDVLLIGDELLAVVRRSKMGPDGLRLEGYYTIPVDSLQSASPAGVYPWRPLGRIEGSALCLQDEPFPRITLFDLKRCA